MLLSRLSGRLVLSALCVCILPCLPAWAGGTIVGHPVPGGVLEPVLDEALALGMEIPAHALELRSCAGGAIRIPVKAPVQVGGEGNDLLPLPAGSWCGGTLLLSSPVIELGEEVLVVGGRELPLELSQPLATPAGARASLDLRLSRNAYGEALLSAVLRPR